MCAVNIAPDQPRCEWCVEPNPEADTQCQSCGGPVSIMEPWVLLCGWCGSSNRRDERADCRSCGGPLPNIPGSHPGKRPPVAPRHLSRAYWWRVMLTKNVMVSIGVVFTLVFGWTVLFGLIGIPLWIIGYRKGKRKLNALKKGLPTKGEILEVTVDTTQRINNRHPFLIHYHFETPGGVYTDKTEAWDPVHRKRGKGEHIWVVYDPENHASNNIWPPVR